MYLNRIMKDYLTLTSFDQGLSPLFLLVKNGNVRETVIRGYRGVITEDNVFYGFIPASGIVNANFMQIAYSDAYFEDYDDDNNPLAIKPSARCSNTLVLTKIEYRVEWKLYAGDVATVRMIIGYYDGEPAGQFYTTIDEIAEDMIGYYGFNIDVCSLRPTDILSKSPIFYLGNIQDLGVS